MNAEIGRPFGTPPFEDSIPADINAMVRAGERGLAKQHERMIAADKRYGLERAAIIEQSRERMRMIAIEAANALHRFDADNERRRENDERVLAVLEQMRDA